MTNLEVSVDNFLPGAALPESDQQRLIGSGLLKQGEVAFKVGENVVAVDSVTGTRRLLKTEGVILESSRRLLKD